jgi:hypothetical protein
MAWLELKAYYVGMLGGMFPQTADEDPKKWINMDRVVSVEFEETRDGIPVARLENSNRGCYIVREPCSVQKLHDFLVNSSIVATATRPSTPRTRKAPDKAEL